LFKWLRHPLVHHWLSLRLGPCSLAAMRPIMILRHTMPCRCHCRILQTFLAKAILDSRPTLRLCELQLCPISLSVLRLWFCNILPVTKLKKQKKTELRLQPAEQKSSTHQVSPQINQKGPEGARMAFGKKTPFTRKEKGGQ